MDKKKGQPSGSSTKKTKTLPRREKRSGKERIRIQKPLHMSARI